MFFCVKKFFLSYYIERKVRKISTLKIYVDEIKNNINLIKSCLPNNQKYCFVSKANCYGYGIELCKYIESDVDYFAVSSASEFLVLKNIVKKDIIILDPIYKNITNCLKQNAIFTISNIECLKKLISFAEKNNVKCRAYIAVNTGMNRFGFSSTKELDEACELIKNTQNIKVLGLFSHYYSGNQQKSVLEQNKKFKKFQSLIKSKFGNNLTYHISATDAAINFVYKNESENSFVRVGIGNYTDKYFKTIELESRVIEIKKLKSGDGAGYGKIFTAKCACTIAVVAIGYGDGILRNIVKNGYVLINDYYCKIVAVCMDAILVDATFAKPKIGSKVTIIGKQKKNQIFICDLATWCDTIEYEIIVRLSDRIERKYIRGKSCKLSQENIEQEN